MSSERFVGARALWHGAAIRELFVAFADPGAVGLSAVAGLLRPLARGSGQGLHVRLADDPAGAERVLQVPLAPGLIVPVAVAGFRVVERGEQIALEPGEGCLALDGEREIERRHGAAVSVRLTDGPRTIDVDAVMGHAASAHLLQSASPA